MRRRPAGVAGYCAPRRVALCVLALCVLGSPFGSAAELGSAAENTAAALVHPGLWPGLPPALPRDAGLERRVAALLSRMTPAQKVGQLIQADIDSITPDDLAHYPLGAVLNGGNSSPHGDKLAPPGVWLALADRFYEASLAAAGSPGIALLWGTDAVHGHNNIPGATIFPHNIALGATRDLGLIRRIGEITALEVRVTGLDWAFSPSAAVARDARWGRTYESYSENPALVRRCVEAMVTGLQGALGTTQFLDAAHIIATPKHFLGDGGTGGVDEGDNPATERELRDLDAAGYYGAIASGAQTVMVSYSSWRGVRMHGNRALLTEVLKGRMGFGGLVLGDWNGHAQLPGCAPDRCAAALNAGLDMLMAPDGWRALHTNTLAEVSSGEIPAARLDDAVRRVLRVKLRAHLDREGRPSSRPFAGRFELLGSAAHRAVAQQAVRESLVLLKNSHHLLPLSPRARVLVAGDGADNLDKQSGGWTINWQGTEPNQDFPHAQSMYAAIARQVTAAGGSVELSVGGEFHSRPDVAIVVFGENPYAEGAGDIGTLEFSPGDKHDLALLRRLRAESVAVVAVFLSGRPLMVNAELNAADSFVAAWLPGPEGAGVADVLFRSASGTLRYDFRGKLPFSWPGSPRVPAVDGGPGEPPLFKYGYGLTYEDDGELAQLPEGDAAAARAIR